MKINFDIPQLLKKGDILIWNDNKFIAVQHDSVVTDLIKANEALKYEIEVLAGRIAAQEKSNKEFIENLREVYSV